MLRRTETRTDQVFVDWSCGCADLQNRRTAVNMN
jgi:hypothetical protein